MCFSEHCSIISKKAHQKAAIILRCFNYIDPPVLVRAFIVFVRPILEYASCVWNPYLKKDIRIIESVQRKFTKRLHGMGVHPYAHRLQILGLQSLERRRMAIDLKTMYKIVHGLTFLGQDPSFIKRRPNACLRGHQLQIMWNTTHKGCKFNFFVSRVGRVWNSLPEEVVTALTLSRFTKLLNELDLGDYVEFLF